MSSRIEQFAPAKINLSLHITGRRSDGFHELETVMAPLSLGDTLYVEAAEKGITLTCSDERLGSGPDNLAHRAADIFLRDQQIASGVVIHLVKRTPVGAGLGGGSSDAAAVLLALRRLFGVAVSDEHLASLAAQLGSDVPFFIYGTAAICRGRGEIIERWPEPISLPGLLVHPGFPVSTPWAYQAYAKQPHKGEVGKSWGGGSLRNDLEPPVFGKYLWIPTVKQWFRDQPEVLDALMSGSGSSVFALLKPEAAGAPTALKERFGKMFGGDSVFAESFQIETR